MVFPAAVELIAGRIAAFLRGVAAQLAAFAKPGDGPVDGGLANGTAFPVQLLFQLLIGFFRRQAAVRAAFKQPGDRFLLAGLIRTPNRHGASSFKKHFI